MVEKAKLLIPPVEHARLMGYIKAALPHEVSGLGLVDKSDDGLVVSKIILLKQECTAGTTELDTGAIDAYMAEMHKAGEDTSKLRLWWHSHGTGGTFWSGIDRNTMKRLVGPGVNWFVFMVGNSKEEFKCSVYVGDPFLLDIEGELKIVFETPDLKEECEKEVKEKVTIKTTAYQGPTGVVSRNPNYVNQHGFPGWQNNQVRVLPKGPKYEDIALALDNFDKEGGSYEEARAAAYKPPRKGKNRKAGGNKHKPDEEDDYSNLAEFYGNHGMTGV